MPPIVTLGLALIAGLAVASLWAGDALAAIGGAALLFIVAGAVARFSGRAAWWLVVIGVVLLGVARGAAADRPPADNDIATWNGALITVVGVVDEEPTVRETFIRFRFAAQAVDDGDGPVAATGGLLVDLPTESSVRYGQVLTLVGRPQPPPVFSGFDYRAYLERQGVRGVLRFPTVQDARDGGGSPVVGALLSARARLVESLLTALPGNTGALAAGLLLGARRALSPSLTEAFQRTGAAHLLAVSGYNMNLVALAVSAVAIPMLGRRNGTIAAILGIVSYAALVGGEPSVLRAAVMAVIALIGALLGRQRDAGVLLVVATAGIALWSPALLSDIGFQLSVAATAGIILVAPPVLAWVTERRDDRGSPGRGAGNALRRFALRAGAEAVVVPIVAAVATTPILASAFGAVSIVTIPVNVLVSPLVAPAMMASFVVAVVGLVSADAARLLGVVAWPFLQGIIAVTQLFAAAPFAALRVGAIGPWAIGAVYGAMGIAYVIARGGARRWAPIRPFALPSLVVAAAILWLIVLTPSPDALTLVFPEVRGESTFIQSSGGRLIVIDTGATDRDVADRLTEAAPFWRRRVDVVIITDWTPDRVGAARELARRFTVGALLAPAPTNLLGARVISAYAERNVPVTVADRPYVVQLEDGATVTVTPVGAALAVTVDRGAFRAALGAARLVENVTLARLPFGKSQVGLYGRPAVAVVTLPPELPSPVGPAVYRTDRVGEVRATARDEQLELRVAKAPSRP